MMTAQTARRLPPADLAAPDRARPMLRPVLRLVPRPAAIPLDDRERHAIALGRADAARLGWDARLASSRFGRLLARATGIRGVTPLADPRLELFRLFAAMMRRGDRRADAVASQLAALGVGPGTLHAAIGLALG